MKFIEKFHEDTNTLRARGHVNDKGLEEGEWQWFRRNGQVLREGAYKNGKAIGTWTTYDPNGDVFETVTVPENNEPENNDTTA